MAFYSCISVSLSRKGGVGGLIPCLALRMENLIISSNRDKPVFCRFFSDHVELKRLHHNVTSVDALW